MTRTLLVLGFVLLVALGVWAMRRGWQHRATRQAGLVPRFPEVPADPGEPELGPHPGLYVGAVVAGDWQDRVAVGGLGLRAGGSLAVHRDGVLLTRTGSRDVWLPRDEIAAVRTDRALAGKAMTTAGLLVLTWRQSGPDTPDLEFAFRADDPTGYPRVLAELAPPDTPAPADSTPAPADSTPAPADPMTDTAATPPAHSTGPDGSEEER